MKKEIFIKNFFLKNLLLWCLPLLCLPVVTTAQSGLKNSIWDVPEIFKLPAYKIISSDSATGLIYNSLSYQGKVQHVFAWYATPGSLTGNKNLDKHLPAVVLVHGGGGKAFKEWAIMWAKKGYAAIAMDLRGNGPKKQHIENGFIEENNQTPYFTITPELSDQWMYLAVADVILAHTLIRSFPEVDSNRTALTGISWGGVITCIVAGLDNRYKAAVPVYGCGYLSESGRMEQQLNLLSAKDRKIWMDQYDPSRYVGNAEIPMLFLNDANDPYFMLSSYMKTYSMVKHKNLCIKIDLKHSHHAGWSNEETFAFINSHINKTPPLPVISNLKVKNDQITASFHSPVKIIKAFLNYTTDASDSVNRKWNTTEVQVKNGYMISSIPPKGTTVWYLSLEDERGLKVSGEVQFLKNN
jgi:dienelactone hydrolase